jgi:hypothetical protein
MQFFLRPETRAGPEWVKYGIVLMNYHLSVLGSSKVYSTVSSWVVMSDKRMAKSVPQSRDISKVIIEDKKKKLR